MKQNTNSNNTNTQNRSACCKAAAMEPRDHSKNRANPKNLMSMGNFIMFVLLYMNLSIIVANAQNNTHYDFVGSYYDGIARVKLNGKYGYINRSGERITPLKYDIVNDFNEGMGLVECFNQGGKNGIYFGFVDKTGREVIPLKYFWASDFHEGLAAVEQQPSISSLKGYIDKTGKVVIPFQFNRAGNFSEGLAAVQTMEGRIGEEKYGYIDKTGKLVIPYKYEKAEDFSEELACVKFNNKRGYINKMGQVIISFKYYIAGNFDGGVAYAMKEMNGATIYIDKKGNEYSTKEAAIRAVKK